MAQRYDLLVFDWDGTLMDSTISIVRAIQHAFRDMGLEVPSDERSRHVIGLGLVDAMRYLNPDLQEADYLRVVDFYRHYYLSRDHEIELFEGVAEALTRYKQQGFWLAVATGKSRKGLDRALGYSGVADLFDITRCADETFSKPHPAMLQELCRELGQDMQRTLMVGDTSHDLQMAGNAGASAVAVEYGAHEPEFLRQFAPLFMAKNVPDLHQWLNENA